MRSAARFYLAIVLATWVSSTLGATPTPRDLGDAILDLLRGIDHHGRAHGRATSTCIGPSSWAFLALVISFSAIGRSSFAFATVNPWDFASNTVELDIVP